MQESPSAPSPSRVRLQRFLAGCGFGSRRACELLIEQGVVRIDGAVADRPGILVDPHRSDVRVRGKTARLPEPVYLALNKPTGVLCTLRDPQERPTVLSLVPAEFGRLFPVGRLDADSEGLLLLTNDGEFAQLIAHPRHHVPKTYHVWVGGHLTDTQVRSLRKGIDHDGERLAALQVRLLRQGPRSCRYQFVLGQGRKRQIRRMVQACGLKVERLRRVAIGDLQLGRLPSGAWRKLSRRDIRALLECR